MTQHPTTPNPSNASNSAPNAPPPPAPSLLERGGSGRTSEQRLWVQLAVLRDVPDRASLATDDDMIAYADVHDPQAVGVVAWSTDINALHERIAAWWHQTAKASPGVRLDHTLAMLGRTYAIGYEPDLQETLIDRPIRNMTAAQAKWAVWYPMRRSGAFEALDTSEQRKILGEHGKIGRAWVEAGLAWDVRLAGHGLNSRDDDFIIGLLGERLEALSKIVQAMRTTTQTSRYVESIGPFFIGRRLD